MTATLIWRPELLNARLIAAAAPAAHDLARIAAMKARSRRVSASVRAVGVGTDFLVGSLHPLGKILEEGASPHTIEPRKRVLKMADGGFVTGPVQHPGSPAQPFLKPTLPLWPALYRRHAIGAFRGI